MAFYAFWQYGYNIWKITPLDHPPAPPFTYGKFHMFNGFFESFPKLSLFSTIFCLICLISIFTVFAQVSSIPNIFFKFLYFFLVLAKSSKFSLKYPRKFKNFGNNEANGQFYAITF